MPLTQNDVYVSRPLTNVSVAFSQDASEFIADRVFPRVPVTQQGGQYWVWQREDWLRNNMKKRADATESQGVDLNVERQNYFASVWALHRDIGDQTRANASEAFNLDNETVNFLTGQYLLNKEYNFVQKYMQPGVWGQDYTGIATGTPSANQRLQWSDENSTPIEDVQRAIIRQHLLTGRRPNKMVVGMNVDFALRNHPEIIERVKYGGTNTSPANVSNSAIAALFGVAEYHVSGAVINNAAEGLEEDTEFFIGNSALLVYAPPSAGLMTPSAGYNFVWTGYLGNAGGGAQISKMRIDIRKADRIEAETAYTQEVVAPDLGALFTNIVAPANP